MTRTKCAVPEAVGTGLLLAAVVGSGIMGERLAGAYWFTSSTSFANPAVTLARSASDTFAGIRPTDAPGFVLAQLAGAAAATILFRWLVPSLISVDRRSSAANIVFSLERAPIELALEER